MDEVVNEVVVDTVETVAEETFTKVDMSKALSKGVAIGATGTVLGYFAYKGIKKLINKIKEKKAQKTDEEVVVNEG